MFNLFSNIFSTTKRSYATRITHKLGPLNLLNNHLVIYPTPANLSYMYN